MSDTPRNKPALGKLSLKRGADAEASETAKLEERLHKVLAQAGLGSRRALEQRIADGLVKVNGEVAQTGMSIKSGDRVELDGKTFVASALSEPARVLIYNKPEGEVTTREDPEGRPTVFEQLPRLKGQRWIAVGRLDINTTGLLLLTTDGEFKRQMELPATGVERSYRARTYGKVSQRQLEDLMMGIEIEGIRYGSINANMERRTGANQWIEMRLKEGKNREVRRVLEHLGLQVSRLIRTSYGPFVLGEMPAGAVNEVLQHDLVAFRKTLK